MKTIVISGADRGLGFSLCKNYLSRGDRVIAGQFMPDWKELEQLKAEYPDRLFIIPLDIGKDTSVKEAADLTGRITDAVDILINCAGIDGKILDIRDGYDYDIMLQTYNINALGALRMTQYFLPLLDKGQGKKICCISSEAGSIGTCYRQDETEYCMSKAALNMGMAIVYNRLKKDGYDIRLYHPGWMNTYMLGVKENNADLDPDEAADLAVKCFASVRRSEKLILESYDGTVIAW